MLLSKVEIFLKNNIVYTYAYGNKGIKPCFTLKERFPETDLNAIYNVKIRSYNKKNGLTFVDYSDDQCGVLNLKPELGLQSGCFLKCQMSWVGDNHKEAKFISDFKLIGKYVILLPNSQKHYFSNSLKLINPKVLLQLESDVSLLSLNKESIVILRSLKAILDKYAKIGLIFRSSIDGISNLNLVEEEIKYLLQESVDLKRNIQQVSKLTKSIPQYIELLRETELANNIEIVTNSQEVYNNLLSYAGIWYLKEVLFLIPEMQSYSTVSASNMVTQSGEPIEIIKTSEFTLEIHNLSGINLIDINAANVKLSFYQTNYLAIDEIIKQIYYKDLRGIILLDFIKNMSSREEADILAKINILLLEDWRYNKVLGFTKAGICEIIRNK